jgi:hypothetical protein
MLRNNSRFFLGQEDKSVKEKIQNETETDTYKAIQKTL